MRMALGVSYLGQRYQGWQSQPSGQTVQDRLEAALAQFATHPVSTLCAGRTDAGVHGLMQVVHFDTELQRSPFSWVRGTNAFLPPDIAVHWARPVPEAFHARACATASGKLAPKAKWQAIAEDKVQPVPCVFWLAMRGLA